MPSIPTSGQIRLGNDFAKHWQSDGLFQSSGNVSDSPTSQRNLGSWHSRSCTGFQTGNNLRLGAAHGCTSMNSAKNLRPPIPGDPSVDRWLQNQYPATDRMTRRFQPVGWYYWDYTGGGNINDTTGEYSNIIYNQGYDDFSGATASTTDCLVRYPGNNVITTANLYLQYYAYSAPGGALDQYTMVLRMYSGQFYGEAYEDYADYWSVAPTGYNRWITVNETFSNFRPDLYPRGVISIGSVTENFDPSGNGGAVKINIRNLKLTRN